MKNLGTMLPPTADSTMIEAVDRVCAWALLRQAETSASAMPAAAAADSTAMVSQRSGVASTSTP